jgi:DNA-binding transcriptional LysR family regulator
MLEEQLGVRLFERAGRRLILTPEGEQLRDFCRRFFAELTVIRVRFSSGDAAVSAPLRIASVSGFGRYVLFPLLCDGEHEGLRFELWYPRETEVLEMVEGGKCDLGFVYEARSEREWRRAETYETMPMVAGSIQGLAATRAGPSDS